MVHSPLSVQMFGDFTLSYGTDTLLSGYARKNKSLYLLQYLLANRQKSFSRDALIGLFYNSAFGVENPSNALKLTIYRLRKMLIDCGLPDKEYILYENGRYSWNGNIPCEIDAEHFSDALHSARAYTLPRTDRIAHYEKALKLYQGDFLPDLATEYWVAPLSIQYFEQYLACVKELWQLYNEQDNTEGMIRISSDATAKYPCEEKIQALKIKSLFKARHINEATDAYESAINMLYTELGVEPSAELVDTYKMFAADLKGASDSIQEIKKFLSDTEQNSGAYYCNLQNFTDAYQVAIRSSERSGINYFLMLLTLKEEKESDNLKIAIKNSLRRGDFFTRYSPKQYLVLLMGIYFEDCAMVFRRIEGRFIKGRRNKETSLAYRVVSANEINLV